MKVTDEQVRLALTQRLKPKRYAFPGIDGQFVAVKALTDTEMDGCRMRATEYLKRSKMANQLELAVDPNFYNRALHREVISASFRDPESVEDFYFPKADDVASLDNVTVAVLYELFCSHQDAMDPYASVSEEEVDALVAQLGKDVKLEEILNSFDADTLRRCVRSLVCKVRSMPA